MRFTILLLLISLYFIEMKPTGVNRQDRAWKMKKTSCELEDCGHLIPEEAYNCVNKCVSDECFEKIYSTNPLEDGEIDMERNRAFIACIRQEYRKGELRAVKNSYFTVIKPLLLSRSILGPYCEFNRISRMKLTKIGPGLDPRLNLWQKVYVWFSAAQMEPLTDLEKVALRRLANGVSWVELVPEEWRNIYGAIYDEYDTIIIEEKEKTKIDKDVPRTFTLFARYTRQLRIVFPEDLTEYYQALTKVLQLASIGRGYCQGVNFIAAKLLFELADEKEAFIVLSFLLKNCQLEILFDSRYSALFDYMRIFEKKLRTFNNKLYKHLKKCEFRSSSYAIEWFTTCFIVTCPGEICLCVIDMILSGINDIMIRMGLALLHTLEHRLLRLDFEKLHESFKDYCMKSDTVYVIVQALKIQFQVDNSVLKAMARKIESLDPGSGGDLRFGKPKKLETPKSNVRGPKFRKNRNKTSTPVTLPSDDSLSEEGEIESEPQLNDESELKPIQLVLKAPVLEESLPDGIDPDSSSPVAQAEEEDNHRNSKSRRRISKLTIKISPKRLNQWKQLRTEKPSPEQTESVTDVSEDVEEGSMSPVTDIHLEKQLMEQFSENYDSEIQSTQSVFKDGTNPTSTKSSSDKSPTEVSSAKSPSWWHWPSFRSGKSPADSSASTSNRQANGQASTKASFSAPTVSTTNSSCPSPLNRRDFRYGSFKGDIDSEVINRKIPPPTSRLFRRRRVLEKFCIDSMEEEEEIIREFYLTDNHDSLLLLHYLPICFAMESIDEGDAPPLSGSRKGSVASNHSPSKDSPSKGLRRLSFLRRFRTSSDLSQPEEKVDVVNIDPSHIRSENEEYIDQGGEVISPNFYRTNHLISEILHSNHRLLENYFEIKEKERERKIIRTSKQGSSPRIRSGKGKSNKVHKTASSNNGIGPTNGHRGIRIKATKFDSLHDSEILQNAMYYSFSQALYK